MTQDCVILINRLLYLIITSDSSLSQQTTVLFEFWLRTYVQFGVPWAPFNISSLYVFADRHDSWLSSFVNGNWEVWIDVTRLYYSNLVSCISKLSLIYT